MRRSCASRKAGWKRDAWAAVAAVSLLGWAPAQAMTVAQMHSLPGGRMMETRVGPVLDAYGLPAAIVESGRPGEKPRATEVHDVHMRLGRGKWALIYQRGGVPRRSGARGWWNPRPRMPKSLARVSRLQLSAEGRVGVVKIDRAAHKTTYAVPADPLAAHKVTEVTGRFASPMRTRLLVEEFGRQCEFVGGPGGKPVMRYWILRASGMLPLNLFAVDFILGSDQEQVMGYTIRGAEAAAVHRRFEDYYRYYLDRFND